MKPIAAPMIGGMISSAVHVLIMNPVIFVMSYLDRMMRVKQLRVRGMPQVRVAAVLKRRV